MSSTNSPAPRGQNPRHPRVMTDTITPAATPKSIAKRAALAAGLVCALGLGAALGLDVPLEQSLAHGDKVIVGLNAQTIWNKPGDHTTENHFVVVTAINTKAGVVHLNSGIKAGQYEQVSIATFTQAWATGHDDKTIATGT